MINFIKVLCKLYGKGIMIYLGCYMLFGIVLCVNYYLRYN